RTRSDSCAVSQSHGAESGLSNFTIASGSAHDMPGTHTYSRHGFTRELRGRTMCGSRGRGCSNPQAAKSPVGVFAQVGDRGSLQCHKTRNVRFGREPTSDTGRVHPSRARAELVVIEAHLE